MTEKNQTKVDFLERLGAMRQARSEYEIEWDICELQVESIVEEDEYGNAIPNTKMEQNHIEFEVGRTNDSFVFDVLPDSYDTNQEQLEKGKYVLDSFLDKEKFYTEDRTFRQSKATYGTAIRDCTLKYELDKIYEYDDTTTDDAVGGGYFESMKTMKEVNREQWYFTAKNLPVRLFYVDDNAINQNDFSKAVDCIKISLYSLEDFKQSFGGMSHINQKLVEEAKVHQSEDSKEYMKSYFDGHVIVYQYFNRITKDYYINVNAQKENLFEGKLVYKSGRLPFYMCQHFPRLNSLYGYGIPYKIRYERAFEVDLTDAIMKGAKLSSGKILTGSSEPTDGDLFVYPGEITMATFTNGMNDLRPIDTRVDLSGLVTAREINENKIRENTGIDLRASYETAEATLGQTEIKEENKSIRQSAVDRLYYEGLDFALSYSLENLEQFAPTRLATYTKVNEKVTKVVYPQIKIDGVKIEKKGKKTIITEDFGNYGYLELTPETMLGSKTIRVVTPGTYNKTLRSIEKARSMEMLDTVGRFIASMQYLPPEQLQEIIQSFNPKQLAEKTKKAFNIDEKAMVADTKKTLKRKKIEEKTKAILSKLQPNVQDSNQTPVGSNQEPRQVRANTTPGGAGGSDGETTIESQKNAPSTPIQL